MTPEEKARQNIDRLFSDAGWSVVDRLHYTPNLSAAAITEGLLCGNLEADYLLFIDGKAVGVLEAKKEDTDVSSIAVVRQAENYTYKVPNWYQTWAKPLPIIYLSNGKTVLFKNSSDPAAEYQEINRIHSPKEICRMLGINNFFGGLPTLKRKGLRDCQFEAITNLEQSFRSGENRALMVLATGAGKTYTACLAAYRFLSYTPMRRILFLVDRNNLGKQAEGEFGMFRLTENGDAFNTIYSVNRLKSASIPEDTNVVISTIQRLFSLLSGQEIEDVDNDENPEEPSSVVDIPENAKLPKDFFDLIIIDECHRSIYGNWRKVLEYFSTARMIGLTATPVPETEAFFNFNRVINYTLEKSIVDGVNVDYRIYRIKTEATESGGAIKKGDKVTEETRYNGTVKSITEKEDRTYTKTELNRSIVNPAQIKLILETYRDAIYSEMYPGREPDMNFIPKTLIFALNDAHASNIVQIAKEVFGRNDDQFVQKITYSAGDSNELIRHFRNDKEFRIAVTVTLVATGTDVKPLEVVMFMRDVESEPLYIQMKGRGVRTIGDEQLQAVTPNADSKDIFFLVDAVGVTEHEKTIAPPGTETNQIISLKELLEKITHGLVEDELLRLLAGRLSRIHNKANIEQQSHFAALAGEPMKDIASRIYAAFENNSLPPFVDINDPNNERKALVRSITNSPQAREYLLILNAGFLTTLQPGEDTIISQGFSVEEATENVKSFEDYIEAHRDGLEALRIIYNNGGEPLTYNMLKDLQQKLLLENVRFNPLLLWNHYALLQPKNVTRLSSKDERDAMTNIIQLVRFGYHQTEKLNSLLTTATQYYNLWCGQSQNSYSDKQKEIVRGVIDYIACNGTCQIEQVKAKDRPYAAQIIQAYDYNIVMANQALNSLSQFLIFRRTA